MPCPWPCSTLDQPLNPLPTPHETYLTWAVRSWEAEVENARRLATRVNVVLTVALAAAAAATKVLNDALVRSPRPWGAVLLAGAVVGVVFVFVAFVRVLVKRQPPERPPSASAHLLPPEDLADVSDATPGHDSRALQRAFLSTAAAAYELHARNADERKRLAAAQQWLIVGAALTLVCGAVYTWIRPL